MRLKKTVTKTITRPYSILRSKVVILAATWLVICSLVKASIYVMDWSILMISSTIIHV